MKGYVMNRFFMHGFVAALLVSGLSVRAFSKEIMPVTVHRGERQVFKGFGGSAPICYPHHPDSKRFSLLPENLRDSLSRRVWKDLDFRFMRIWSSPYEMEGYSNKEEYYAWWYAPELLSIIEHAKKYQPGLKIFHSPFSRRWIGETIGNVNTWAAHCAAQMYYFRRYGIQVDYTSIANEPEVHDEINEETAPILVRQYRRELNRWGLNDIKVMGPEAAATDPKARGILKSIVSNVDALDAIHGFTVHSYNWSVTEEAVDILKPLLTGGEKELWQTEAGAGPFRPEAEENAELASDVVAKYLADMNQLCNVWFFFILYQGYYKHVTPGSGWVMMEFNNEMDTFDESVLVLLKYYYFKQLSRTFRPGTVFRKSTAHANRISGKYWRSEDTSMVFAYGEKAPFYCAAGVTPDGSWAIGINNHTGFVADPYSTPRPRVDFEAHITVEELVGRGDIPFAVHRCNAQRGNPADPYIHPEDTIIMRNGTIIVDSLGQFDLITLRSPPGIEEALASRHQEKSIYRSGMTVSRGSLSPNVQIRFAVCNSTAGGMNQAVLFAIFDGKGKTVRTIDMGALSPGSYEYAWDGCSDTGAKVPAGAYFIRLSGRGWSEVSKIIYME